jgi:hypothetical protein
MNEMVYWVVNYLGNEFLTEAKTKIEAVDNFLEHFLQNNKGFFDKEAMKQAIMSGTPKRERWTESFVYQLCLPKKIQSMFAARLVEMLSDITCMFANPTGSKGKNELYHKAFFFRRFLYELEIALDSIPIFYLRRAAEDLYSEKDGKLVFQHEKKRLLMVALLTEKLEET